MTNYQIVRCITDAVMTKLGASKCASTELIAEQHFITGAGGNFCSVLFDDDTFTISIKQGRVTARGLAYHQYNVQSASFDLADPELVDKIATTIRDFREYLKGYESATVD